jgi:ABC-type phosphate transport system permease subunit
LRFVCDSGTSRECNKEERVLEGYIQAKISVFNVDTICPLGFRIQLYAHLGLVNGISEISAGPFHDGQFHNAFVNTLAMSLMGLVAGFLFPISSAVILNEVRLSFVKRFVQIGSRTPIKNKFLERGMPGLFPYRPMTKSRSCKTR